MHTCRVCIAQPANSAFVNQRHGSCNALNEHHGWSLQATGNLTTANAEKLQGQGQIWSVLAGMEISMRQTQRFGNDCLPTHVAQPSAWSMLRDTPPIAHIPAFTAATTAAPQLLRPCTSSSLVLCVPAVISAKQASLWVRHFLPVGEAKTRSLAKQVPREAKVQRDTDQHGFRIANQAPGATINFRFHERALLGRQQWYRTAPHKHLPTCSRSCRAKRPRKWLERPVSFLHFC
jgi:hypothetical protein